MILLLAIMMKMKFKPKLMKFFLVQLKNHLIYSKLGNLKISLSLIFITSHSQYTNTYTTLF